MPEGKSDEEAPSGETEESQAQEFDGIEYKIVSKGQITETAEGAVSGKKMIYDVVTGKISKEEVSALANKIIADITSEDSEIDAITMYFCSEESSIGKKIDVAIIDWIPNKEISVTMMEE